MRCLLQWDTYLRSEYGDDYMLPRLSMPHDLTPCESLAEHTEMGAAHLLNSTASHDVMADASDLQGHPSIALVMADASDLQGHPRIALVASVDAKNHSILHSVSNVEGGVQSRLAGLLEKEAKDVS